ncbi:MAG: hypothetical protein ACYCSS_08825 [Sulfuriferula sp.]
MDFSSFFSRKDKKNPASVSATAAVKPKSKEQAIAEIHQAPLTEQQFEPGVAQGNIVVTEIESNFSPGVEDAAMLYANGRIDEAINLLKLFIVQSPQEDSLWLMLFDLYWVVRQQQEFERLAIDYAVKREKSPPVWLGEQKPDSVQLPVRANKKLTAERQLFSLKGRLDPHMADRIKLLQEAANGGVLQLDLSGITEVSPEGCKLLQTALAKLQKQQSKLQIASGALVGLLQQYIGRSEGNTPEQWLLLLQLYQLQGKQLEFEDLAVAFAVHFELSPPSWEAPAQVAQVVAVAPEAEKSVDAESCYFKMKGTINSASASAFSELKPFAVAHKEIIIDFFEVDRVEFASVGLLMDALMALIPSGKKVAIVGSNMMVYVLLVVMGIDQMAQIAPRRLN